jgi:hypothetical protein
VADSTLSDNLNWYERYMRIEEHTIGAVLPVWGIKGALTITGDVRIVIRMHTSSGMFHQHPFVLHCNEHSWGRAKTPSLIPLTPRARLALNRDPFVEAP